jgi:DNA polymerase-3 subunit alpha (Gram-positive type)
MDVCKAKIKEIEGKENAAAVEEDMLVTLEVCYEFYLRGFTFEKMDLYRSKAVDFALDEEKNALIPPFSSVPGLGESAAHDIEEQVAARNGAPFISVEEFSVACTKVSKAHLEGLKTMGALDGLPETSQLTLF